MILISTNMYDNKHLGEVFYFTDKYKGVGVELFPMYHESGYDEVLEKYSDKLMDMPVSFHEQYYDAEHSCEEGTGKYCRTMDYMMKTIAACEKYHSRHIVFHYNNWGIMPGQKEQMLERARSSFVKVIGLAKERGIDVILENTGIPRRKNTLLNEEEFIKECEEQDVHVLIDIGHAWCNGWNLSHVMEALKDRIVAYHIHNNDLDDDLHQRIHNGRGDFDKFKDDYLKYTPNADLVLEYLPDVREDIKGIEEDIEECLRLQKK